jgi:hypothetical protein
LPRLHPPSPHLPLVPLPPRSLPPSRCLTPSPFSPHLSLLSLFSPSR